VYLSDREVLHLSFSLSSASDDVNVLHVALCWCPSMSLRKVLHLGFHLALQTHADDLICCDRDIGKTIKCNEHVE
jgi:hypothetical protein